MNRRAEARNLLRRHIEQELMLVPGEPLPVPVATSRLPAAALPPAITAAPAPAADGDKAAAMAALVASFRDCARCRLSEARKSIVFGSGNLDAALMIVGEWPGAEEDLQGLPFVGPAGQLLTKMLAAIDLAREQVFITNVVKCRPPGNRNPEPDEIAACGPLLAGQIAIIRPRLILALGGFAARTLVGTDEHVGITKMRGRTFLHDGIPCLPTFHPAYLLRNPAGKREAWVDMKRVRELLAEEK